MKHAIRSGLRGLLGLLLIGSAAACGSDVTSPEWEAPAAPEAAPPIDGAGPESPEPVTTGGVSPDSVALGDSIFLVARPVALESDVTVSAWMGPSGGVIEIPETGFRLDVPPGAVRWLAFVQVTAKAGVGELYEFGPHGTSFDVPVRLSFAAETPEAAQLLVAEAEGVYLGAGALPGGAGGGGGDDDDEEGQGGSGGSQQVQVLEFFQLTQDGSRVFFETDHFSGYAMAW